VREDPCGGPCSPPSRLARRRLGSRGVGRERLAWAVCVRSARPENPVRRSPHELTRAPDPSLGRGPLPWCGLPFPRTPGSTAAPRCAQAPPPHGTVRHGRLPGRPCRLRPPPRMGGPGLREPLRIPGRRAGPVDLLDLLAPERRPPAPGLPRARASPPPGAALPDHDGGAGQGPDRGEQGGGPAALPRHLLARGQGDRGRAAALGGAAAAVGRDLAGTGHTQVRAGADCCLRDPGLPRHQRGHATSACSRLAHAGHSHRHGPRVTSGARNEDDPARTGRHITRRGRPPHRRPAPAPRHGQP